MIDNLIFHLLDLGSEKLQFFFVFTPLGFSLLLDKISRNVGVEPLGVGVLLTGGLAN